MSSAPDIVAHRQLATCSRNRRCAPPSNRSALERLPVLARDHCNEVLQRALPMSECALGACAPGVPSVLLYQLTQYVAVAEILTRASSTSPMLHCRSSSPNSSSTNAIPPLIPAPKFRPVRPSTTTVPPVM